MKTARKILLVLMLLLAVVFGFGYSGNSTVKADELSDLNAQIIKKQAEKEATLKKIKDIDARIKALSASKGSLASQLTSLQTEQTNLDTQIKDLDVQIVDQEKLLAEFDAVLNEKETRIRDKINYLYKLSFAQPNMFFSSHSDLKEYFDEKAGLNVAIGVYKNEIKDYYSKIELAKLEKVQLETDKVTASDARKATEDQIASVRSQIAAQDAAIASANKTKSTLVIQSNELGAQLNQMSALQRQLLEAELNKMNASGQVPQMPLQSGQYYFLGRGRDLIEGHGMGMSQWGMYGMASAPNNWTYDRILTFYYPGTVIGNYVEPQTITVTRDSRGLPPITLSFKDYLSGIGEVPNSWPAEAVKAQVVAARTYAMRICQTQSGQCQICDSASCQVYRENVGKAAFVDATQGKVILSGGSPIVAYYSASHRGCSSSLSTVWGTADKSYIQSVNDNQYAYKNYKSPNPYNTAQQIETYNWKWRTNGYSAQELTNIFNRSSSMSVGTFQSIQVTKDACGRAKTVKINGSAGSKTLTGWNFRAIFNANTPYADYLYSTELDFYQF